MGDTVILPTVNTLHSPSTFCMPGTVLNAPWVWMHYLFTTLQGRNFFSVVKEHGHRARATQLLEGKQRLTEVPDHSVALPLWIRGPEAIFPEECVHLVIIFF